MAEIEICDEKGLEKIISLIIDYINNIVNKDINNKDFVLIGVKRRGAILADRIRKILINENNTLLNIGYLDISLYRDDLTEISDLPQLLGTEIEFDIKNKKIFLIDDVIFTGRTVRAAIEAILDLGRPKKILLITIIDRNNRELPIQPDFTGKRLETSFNDIVNVYLKEIDNKEGIFLMRNN